MLVRRDQFGMRCHELNEDFARRLFEEVDALSDRVTTLGLNGSVNRQSHIETKHDVPGLEAFVVGKTINNDRMRKVTIMTDNKDCLCTELVFEDSTNQLNVARVDYQQHRMPLATC